MESNLLSSPELSCMDKLSKWDGNEDSCLAPLNELQKDSFLELASVATNRPMPIEVGKCFHTISNDDFFCIMAA